MYEGFAISNLIGMTQVAQNEEVYEGFYGSWPILEFCLVLVGPKTGTGYMKAAAEVEGVNGAAPLALGGPGAVPLPLGESCQPIGLAAWPP